MSPRRTKPRGEVAMGLPHIVDGLILTKKNIMNKIALQLTEGQPIFYSRSGRLPELKSELILIDGLSEIDILPLSKMGKRFKKNIQELTNLIF